MGAIYRGSRGETRAARVTVERGGRTRPLHHVEWHSSDFEWGYAGSGPADLALAILRDHLGQTIRRREIEHGPVVHESLHLHQQFKAEVVAGLNTDAWELTAEEVDAWLAPWRTGKRQLGHRSVGFVRGASDA